MPVIVGQEDRSKLLLGRPMRKRFRHLRLNRLHLLNHRQESKISNLGPREVLAKDVRKLLTPAPGVGVDGQRDPAFWSSTWHLKTIRTSFALYKPCARSAPAAPPPGAPRPGGATRTPQQRTSGSLDPFRFPCGRGEGEGRQEGASGPLVAPSPRPPGYLQGSRPSPAGASCRGSGSRLWKVASRRPRTSARCSAVP